MGSAAFQSERLRLGRHFFGFTQAELGEQVSASRQYIHQLETGKTPSEEMVNALADALDVYPAFFFSDIQENVTNDHCHFRKLQSTPLSVTQQAIAHGVLFAELVSYLEKRLTFPLIDFPQIEISDSEDIETAAETCRRHWGLTIDQPIKHMTRVIERAGAVCVSFESMSIKLDALSIDHRRPLIVRSTSKKSQSRLRFDIAHECGHLVMHQGVHTGDRETEAQANRFASAFLMPRRAFLAEFPRSLRLDWRKLFALKIRWNVSVQAIVRRGYDLGLLDAAQYRRANIYITKNGWKKSEPYEPEVEETPELLWISLRELEAQYGSSLQDVAGHLNVKPRFLGRLIGVSVPVAPRMSDQVIDINQYRHRR